MPALRERGVRREEIGERKEKSKLAEVANIIIDTGFSVLPSQFSSLLTPYSSLAQRSRCL
jgi:hypothetical protein